MTQEQKAQTLRDLHLAGPLLILPNVWDPIGARILAHKGYPAVATASAAISASLGFEDGEVIHRDTMIEAVSRISRSIDIPLTADMEKGYGDSLSELAETVVALLDTGAVGVNLEDSVSEGASLRSVDEQCQRIACVREPAATYGVEVVLNARIDSFLSDQFSTTEASVDEAISRARAYRDAGADCVYPIGPGDHETLSALRSGIVGPINALATTSAISLPQMEAIGIGRVSFGPFIFRSCLHKFAGIVDALQNSGGYECFGQEMMSHDDTAAFLSSSHEVDTQETRESD